MIEPTEFIGENRVAVPSHFFKVILAETAAEGAGGAEVADMGPAISATPAASAPALFAFMISNQHGPLEGQPSDYLTTIDLIETLTGLDFFSALADSVEVRLEAEVALGWPRR
jgi:DNA/RNA endonuclease G (NUC1)